MNIQTGQILLLVALAFFVMYVFRLRTVMFDRLIYIACALAGIILVIHPDLASLLAHKLGIGRGTDLLIYLFIIATLFYFVATTSNMRKMQRQLTIVIRKMALETPSFGQGLKPDKTGYSSEGGSNLGLES